MNRRKGRSIFFVFLKSLALKMIDIKLTIRIKTMPHQKPLKISFCTTCMNRLEHLQKTLPKNLADNADYENLEFVILDYNSDDGLDNWVQENLKNWHKKVVYFRTIEPQNYARSHSRNMVFRLATGDILCNLDADNFIGKGFASYINEGFSKNNNIYLEAQKENLQDIVGKICFKKLDFETLNGYDEKISNYGFEDNDFKNRLQNLNLKPIYFSQNKFLKVITHEDIERVRNESFFKNLKDLFIQKITPFQSKIIFVFNDATFESAEIMDNLLTPTPAKHHQIERLDKLKRYTILENSVKKGLFEAQNMNQPYEKINEENHKMMVIYFYCQLKNKVIWAENLAKKTISVNQSGYGKGIVFRNFDYQNPITLT